MMSEPVDVVILGAVRHARTYATHIATRGDLRVVAVAEEVGVPDGMREAAQRLADDLGVPVRDVSRLEGVGLAIVCSEPTRHARLVALALAQGVNVLCDKPLATSAADLVVIEEAAQGAGAWCAVITRALAPAVQSARAIVESGRIGLPRSVDVEFLSDDAYLRDNPEEIALVLDTSLSGGGELMNFLGYPIDVVRAITGCEPIDVYARAGALTLPGHAAAGVEDIGTASLAFNNGLMVSVLAGRVPVVPQPANGAFTIRIIGSHGHLEFDADGPLIREFGRDGERIVRLGRSAVDAVFDDVVRVARSGDRPRYDHRDAAVAVRTIEAAYRSVSSGRVESVAR